MRQLAEKTFAYNFEQRSPEWNQARLGRVGSSEAIGISTDARMKTLLYAKLAEHFTGETEEFRITDAMQYGIDMEPVVIDLLEKQYFISIQEVGLITNTELPLAHWSPDGLYNDSKMGIEIKCPTPKNHLKYILDGGVPSEYHFQIAQAFAIHEGLESMLFVSYNHKVTECPMFVFEVGREDFEKQIAKWQMRYNMYEASFNELKRSVKSYKL